MVERSGTPFVCMQAIEIGSLQKIMVYINVCMYSRRKKKCASFGIVK